VEVKQSTNGRGCLCFFFADDNKDNKLAIICVKDRKFDI